MKKVILRYGLYSIISIVALSSISMMVLNETSALAEMVGYLIIALAMSFVFFGMRHYRDRINGGRLSFGQGLKLGLLMVLLPAIAFGLFDILYTRVINPAWYDTYTTRMLSKMDAARAGAAEKAAFLKQMEWFRKPVNEFLLMAASVFIVGLIATVISALSLMRKAKPQLSM